MHTSDTSMPIDELEFTEGWLDGRHVWLVSDGTVLPFISGGAVDDDQDDDDQDDDADGDDDLDDDDQDDDGDEDDVEELKAELAKWKRQSRKHEQRAKENRRQLDRLRRGKGSSSSTTKRKRDSGSGDGDDVDVDAIRDEVRNETRKEFAERSVEVFLDAQVEAGRLDGDQADVLLDSIDPTKFIDDDGDVDTDKVKALIEGIAKPATGDGKAKKKGFPDTGQGRRSGGQRRREKSSSVSAGRELFSERHGKSNQNN